MKDSNTFTSLSDAKDHCAKKKIRALIFCQNTRPEGKLVYMVVPFPVVSSVGSKWPEPNSNGPWRLAARVEMNVDGEFVTY